MSYQTTLAGLAVSAVLILVSWLGLRLPRRDLFRVPWFPWNALMFLALTLFVLMAANLPSVWPR